MQKSPSQVFGEWNSSFILYCLRLKSEKRGKIVSRIYGNWIVQDVLHATIEQFQVMCVISYTNRAKSTMGNLAYLTDWKTEIHEIFHNRSIESGKRVEPKKGWRALASKKCMADEVVGSSRSWDLIMFQRRPLNRLPQLLDRHLINISPFNPF